MARRGSRLAIETSLESTALLTDSAHISPTPSATASATSFSDLEDEPHTPLILLPPPPDMPPLPSPIHAADDPDEEAASVGGVGSERESVDDEDVALSGSEESEEAPPREVGHNLYILAHKLAKFVPLTYY